MDEREWFVLQGQLAADHTDEDGNELPAGWWCDALSLGGWDDPAVRAEVLADFRVADPDDDIHDNPYGAWRMVRRTEEVLDE